MEEKILVNLSTDHIFESANEIIGREGEGNTSRLEITVPEILCGCSVYLDFEKPNGEKLRTPKLEIENGVAVYDVVPYLLTDDGEIKVQAVLITASGGTWKSSIKKYINQHSINALDDIPDKENFLYEAQKVLDQFDKELEELAEALSNDTEFVERITQHINTASGVTTITGSKLNFFVGTQAEYEALPTKDKENLFAIISDDNAKAEIETAMQALRDKDDDIENELQALRKSDVDIENAMQAIEGKQSTTDNRLNSLEALTGENGEVKKATNATNATNATYATYASADTSKGTIEQRLTALGFKEGSVTLNLTPSTTTANTFKRQGNFVIFDLQVSYSTSFGDIVPTSGKDADSWGFLGSLPKAFYPAKEMVFFVRGGVTASGSSLYNYSKYLKITTDGKVYWCCDASTTIEKNLQSLQINDAGYEATPIT